MCVYGSVRVQEAKSVTCVCGTHVHTVVPGTHHIIHTVIHIPLKVQIGTYRLQVKKYKIQVHMYGTRYIRWYIKYFYYLKDHNIYGGNIYNKI